MPTTFPFVKFGLYNLLINPDAVAVCSETLQFSDITAFAEGDNVKDNPFATFEPDEWLLDGNYKSDASDVGIMGTVLSGSNGVFAVPPTLTITFGSVHSLTGLVIHFSQLTDDYCVDMDVAYYDVSNVLIRTDNYSPTSWELSTNQAVVNAKKIIITFTQTSKPYRFLRVTGIDYGKLVYFIDEISSANITEQISPVSAEMPSNVFDFQLSMSDDSFSILDPDSDYANLQQKQPVDAYETINGEQVYMGRFYLTTWQNVTERKVTFHCLDAISLLGDIPFYGAGFGSQPIFNWIFGLSGMESQSGFGFTLDPAIQFNETSGEVPNGNCRDALQQIALSGRGYVTCARSNKIQVKAGLIPSAIEVPDFVITDEEKGMEQSVTLRDLVTGIDIYYYLGVNAVIPEAILFSATLTPGSYKIKYDGSYSSFSITGAAFTAQNSSSAFITVSVTGLVEIKATRKNTYGGTIYNLYNASLGTGVKTKVLEIKDLLTINSVNKVLIAQHIYDYYQERVVQTAKLYANKVAVGNSVLIDSLSGKKVIGVVERAEIDLAKGFVSQVKIIGSLST